jgi:sodium-dependent dicarboxylate transporter 2/3/5
VSVLAIILLFLLPVSRKKFTMDWDTARKYVPWGTLILFGGGLALGKAIANTGLSSWIASYLTLFGSVNIVVLLLAIAVMSVLLSEVTSNTATTSMLMPVMFALGIALNRDPMTFMITSAVATSMVFSLPVATPPNAIVFGTGYVSIEKMAKNGIMLDLIGVFIWTIVVYLIIGMAFGIVTV